MEPKLILKSKSLVSKMKLTKDLCELFGIYLGDGCISETKKYYELAIAGDIKEEIDYYKTHIVPLFNKELAIPLANKQVKGKAYHKVGVYGIYVFDKKIVNTFKTLFKLQSGSKKNVIIPKEILSNEQYLISTLRGLFDTDGSIYFDKNYTCKDNKSKVPKIGLGMISKNLIHQVYVALLNLGFKPMLIKPYQNRKGGNKLHRVILYRRKDIARWVNEINFNNPKHKTKYLIWEKFGECKPYTTLKQRKIMLSDKL